MDVYKHPDSEELADYDLEKLNDFSVNQALYYYQYGDYEGHGTMILVMTDGTLALHDMSHCSCYGPMEDLGNNIVKMKYTTLEELVEDQKDFRMTRDDDYYGMNRVIALFKTFNAVN
jgi:hypothetical protein